MDNSLSKNTDMSSCNPYEEQKWCDREARKKERLEGEVKQLKTALEARQADIKTKSAAAQQSEEQVKRLEQMLRESQVATDRVQKEFNLLNEKVQKLHHDLEDQIHTNTQLLAENSQKAVELKQKEEDIVAVKVSWVSQLYPSLLLWSVEFHNYVHHCYCGHNWVRDK
jgi:chromosome segregation ATPase